MPYQLQRNPPETDDELLATTDELLLELEGIDELELLG